MRAVLQRVIGGSVSVDNKLVSEIGHGLVILLGIGHEDTETTAIELAKKTANIRIFEDDQNKLNLSILNSGGSILVVSQFTLYADTRKGLRPSFTDAAAPEKAKELVEQFCIELRKLGITTLEGIFGAHMKVELINDGPVTIVLEIPPQVTNPIK